MPIRSNSDCHWKGTLDRYMGYRLTRVASDSLQVVGMGRLGFGIRRAESSCTPGTDKAAIFGRWLSRRAVKRLPREALMAPCACGTRSRASSWQLIWATGRPCTRSPSIKTGSCLLPEGVMEPPEFGGSNELLMAGRGM